MLDCVEGLTPGRCEDVRRFRESWVFYAMRKGQVRDLAAVTGKAA